MATQDIDRELSVMIGERIRTARALVGLSQERLGEMLGITFQQVQKYESGKNRISAPVLMRAAKVLGQPIEFFTNTEQGSASGLEGLGSREIKLARRISELPQDVSQALNSLVLALSSPNK